jgi:hypothetical protein
MEGVKSRRVPKIVLPWADETVKDKRTKGIIKKMAGVNLTATDVTLEQSACVAVRLSQLMLPIVCGCAL